MPISRKRKKAVLKAKNEAAGRRKMKKQALKHQIKKVEQFKQLLAHQANTTQGQAEDIYSQMFNPEEE